MSRQANRRSGALNLTVPFLIRLLPSRLIDHLGMKWMNSD